MAVAVAVAVVHSKSFMTHGDLKSSLVPFSASLFFFLTDDIFSTIQEQLSQILQCHSVSQCQQYYILVHAKN